MTTLIDLKTGIQKSEIAALASQLWDKAGKPSGRDLEFWLRAEAQLLAARKPAAQSLPEVAPKPIVMPEATKSTAPPVAAPESSAARPSPSTISSSITSANPRSNTVPKVAPLEPSRMPADFGRTRKKGK